MNILKNGQTVVSQSFDLCSCLKGHYHPLLLSFNQKPINARLRLLQQTKNVCISFLDSTC